MAPFVPVSVAPARSELLWTIEGGDTMSFNIEFDYRFDTLGFFDDPGRRAILDAAAAEWEAIIQDEFADISAGTSFLVSNQVTSSFVNVTLDEDIDDIVVFVQATDLSGNILALAGPTGYSARGDVHSSRISSDYRGQGPVTDFEPWAGVMIFDTDRDWHFGLDLPGDQQIDALSVAVHELGHVLGIGTSGAFDAMIDGQTFTGPNAVMVNGGDGLPLHDDLSHVANGFADGTVSMDPFMSRGERVLLSEYDKALLADIGYELEGFSKQGTQPDIFTDQGELVFGTVLNDTMDGLAGNDRLQGDQGDDLLMGNDGRDTLFGQSGDDTLMGGAGNDQLQGGDGDDVLRGGAGTDQIFGQTGIDTFVIQRGEGSNIINDFDPATEVIRLIDSGFTSVKAVVDAVIKPFSNLSQIRFTDGTTVEIFHASQNGTPLTEANFELLNTELNTPPGGGVTVAGDATQGAVLRADTSALSDLDGLGLFSFAWLRDGKIISGATDGTYTLTQYDVGARMSVHVRYTDGKGMAEFAGSTETEAVRNVNDAPIGSVGIKGSPTVGQALVVNAAELRDPDGIGSLNFSWLRDGEEIGVDSDTYVVQVSDAGARIQVAVRYTDAQGTTETVLSAATEAVVIGDMLLEGTDADDLMIGNLGNDTLIGGVGDDTLQGGAGADRFVIIPGGFGISVVDVEHRVDKLDLTAFDRKDALAAFYALGDGRVLTFSDGTQITLNIPALPIGDVIFADGNLPPEGAVILTGDLTEGETLTADVSGITDADGMDPAGGQIQWMRDGVAIAAATTAEYILSARDVGTQISVVFSYTDAFGNAEAVTASAPQAVSASGRLIEGDGAADTLLGWMGDDMLIGAEGDDRLIGGGGDDTMNGGEGTDTAAFTGWQSSYTLHLSAQGAIIEDRRTDGSGVDTLMDIEFLDFDINLPMFAGTGMDLRMFKGATALSQSEMEDVVELYIAYFNRAPDAVGLAYWANAFAEGLTLHDMATLFIDQPETRATYPEDMSTHDFATAVYNNVLGRTPDQAGLDFWVGVIESGAITRDAFILAVLRGAKKTPSSDADAAFIAQKEADQAYLQTKTDIGAYFAVHKGLSDVESAEAVMALFDGSDTSVADATDAIEAYFADALDAQTGNFLMPIIGVLEDPFAL
jgi:Ca2+-binding RTX toxin-like protein